MPSKPKPFDLLKGEFQRHHFGNRTASTAMLAWFLETVWRLDPEEVSDLICDGGGDKGIDALDVDEDLLEVTVFQAKHRTNAKQTQGDAALRELMGVATYFADEAGIQSLLASAPNEELRKLIERLGLEAKLAGRTNSTPVRRAGWRRSRPCAKGSAYQDWCPSALSLPAKVLTQAVTRTSAAVSSTVTSSKVVHPVTSTSISRFSSEGGLARRQTPGCTTNSSPALLRSTRVVGTDTVGCDCRTVSSPSPHPPRAVAATASAVKWRAGENGLANPAFTFLFDHRREHEAHTTQSHAGEAESKGVAPQGRLGQFLPQARVPVLVANRVTGALCAALWLETAWHRKDNGETSRDRSDTQNRSRHQA